MINFRVLKVLWIGKLMRMEVRRTPVVKKQERRARLGVEVLENRTVPSVTAVDDSYTVVHDRTLTVMTPTLIANDIGNYDEETQTYSQLQVSAINGIGSEEGHWLITLTSGATLEVASNGEFIYTPVANSVYQDSFQYSISDGVYTATATVSINITNTAPTATAQILSTSLNQVIHDIDPLAGAADADGDSLNAQIYGPPSNGSLVLNANGKYDYYPSGTWTGTETFNVLVSDGIANAAMVTLTINVTAADTPSYTVILETNPSYFGDNATLIARVTALDPLITTVPTGTVTFWEGNTSLGTRNLDANGQATLTISTLSIGTHEITAWYNGDSTFAASTAESAGTGTQTVYGGRATGRVWVDANSNGLQDNGEVGLADVTVNLLNIAGAVVSTTTTDANGIYNFCFLDPSLQYAVQVVKPEGNLFTFFHVGNNTSIDSDTDRTTGGTSYFQVAAGWVMTCDSGLINMAGRAANSLTGPGVVPGDSMYTYLLALTGQPCFSWSITGTPAPVVGDGNTSYDSATDTTLVSLPLTFSNNPADITVNAIVGGQVVASKEIYVVKVIVSDPQGGQAFAAGTPQDQANLLPGGVTINGQPVNAQLKVVNSGVPGLNVANPGLVWQAAVTLVGPNDNQGVNMIHVGFIQNVQWTSYSGSYGAAGNLVSPLVGKSAIDIAAEPNAAPQPPWYAATIGWNQLQLPPTFFNATQQVNSATIATFDTPAVALPATYANNNLQRVDYEADFTLDVAAQTTDTSNGADLSYWGQKRANWTFNGNGNVAPNTFTWTGDGVPLANPAGVFAPIPNSWDTNTPTTLMPEAYGGSTANQLFNEGKFNSP